MTIRIANMAFGLCLLVAPAPAIAQSPAGKPLESPKKTYTRNTTFNLPVQMEERIRKSLKEVRLYVRRDGGNWELAETAPPAQAYFQFRCPADGEYLFGLVTVDRQDRQNPADLDQSMQLRVVVDTKAPELTATIVEEGGTSILKVEATDANLDPKSVAAFVRNKDGERPLKSGEKPFHFPLTAADRAGTIRVVAGDHSSNIASKVIAPGRDIGVTPKDDVVVVRSPLREKLAPGPGEDDVFYTKNRRFLLPIEMTEETRAKLKEVQLHIRKGGGLWQRLETAEPTQRDFMFAAPADGEYVFGVVTVDRDGKTSAPGEVHRVRVVVDTTPPEITASLVMENGQAIVKVSVTDANLDPASVRTMVALKSDEQAATKPGQFQFRLDVAQSQSITITAADRAGNVATRELVPQKTP